VGGLVVCLSRGSEPLHAGGASWALGSIEGPGDLGVTSRARGHAAQVRPATARACRSRVVGHAESSASAPGVGREPALGLSTDRRRAQEPGARSLTDHCAQGFGGRCRSAGARARTGSRGALSCANRLPARSPVTSSRSRRSGCSGSTSSSSSRWRRAGLSSSPARRTLTAPGWRNRLAISLCSWVTRSGGFGC
jgi:hypothetical protein